MSIIIYTVKPGDTLWSIAQYFNTTVEEIMELNPNFGVETCQLYQKIKVPDNR